MTVYFEIPAIFNGLIDSASIEKSVILALEHQGSSSNADLTIVFVDDHHMQELNREFRQENTTTDVLAFPAGYEDPDSHHTYLGDVIISIPQATIQAKQSHHSTNEEVHLLAIHGVLHLLGHDDLEADDKARMWLAQEQILKITGLNISLSE